MSFTDRELKTATAVARRVTNVARGYVEFDDVYQSIMLWMWENVSLLQRWRDEEKPNGYLNSVLYRKGLAYVDRERRLRTGAEKGDLTYYTPAMVRELLSDMFDYVDWLPSPDPAAERSPSRPSEGNNRLAALADVAGAFAALPEQDRARLEMRFADGGVDWEVCASLWETTPDGARKSVDRIIDRLVDRLGGPPPWVHHGRRVRSNAAAQAEVRE